MVPKILCDTCVCVCVCVCARARVCVYLSVFIAFSLSLSPFLVRARALSLCFFLSAHVTRDMAQAFTCVGSCVDTATADLTVTQNNRMVV